MDYNQLVESEWKKHGFEDDQGIKKIQKLEEQTKRAISRIYGNNFMNKIQQDSLQAEVDSFEGYIEARDIYIEGGVNDRRIAAYLRNDIWKRGFYKEKREKVIEEKYGR